MELDKLLRKVIRVARQAGEEILNYYHENRPLNVQKKEDDSPVTLADIAAHEIIKAGLAEICPTIPLLSEEDPIYDFEKRSGWQQYWLVDPLDGTREFIAKTGQFTVNIALIENAKPILGVIYVPLKDRIYAGASNLGCIREEGGVNRKVHVSPWVQGNELVIVATRREMQEKLQDQLLSISPIKVTYRSSSLKFSLIAEGRADIYLRKEPIHEWDTAAGQAIVESAGGAVLDLNWKALRYNTKPSLLNPPFIALGDSERLLPVLNKMAIFEEN